MINQQQFVLFLGRDFNFFNQQGNNFNFVFFIEELQFC